MKCPDSDCTGVHDTSRWAELCPATRESYKAKRRVGGELDRSGYDARRNATAARMVYFMRKQRERSLNGLR